MNKVDKKRNQLRNKLIDKIPTKSIVLCSIVRNESKNMVRLLDSLLDIIDYVSIVDTGSTDNTIQVIKNWLTKHNVPGTIHQEPFKNFGYNRTHSTKMAKKTYPQADYLLLSDADFVWKVDVGNKFNKKLLFAHQYSVTQRSHDLAYTNIRLLSNQVDWVCEGVTHEYWAPAPVQSTYKGPIVNHHLTTIEIVDLEDGGCKSDKYERDERLLELDLQNPDLAEFLKIRYSFYLAQTYKCLQKFDKSIAMYHQRISYGGWDEEIYMSYYQMGIAYEMWKTMIIYAIDNIMDKSVKTKQEEAYLSKWNPNNLSVDELKVLTVEYINEAIKWHITAWEFRKTRCESLAKAVILLRDIYKHEEAYKYCHIARKIPLSKDTLFVEPLTYDSWFYDYELSINCFYLQKIEEGQKVCLKLLEKEDLKPEVRASVENHCNFYL
jgi:glycosyltransferase involved in cell wall biosynthesis